MWHIIQTISTKSISWLAHYTHTIHTNMCTMSWRHLLITFYLPQHTWAVTHLSWPPAALPAHLPLSLDLTWPSMTQNLTLQPTHYTTTTILFTCSKYFTGSTLFIIPGRENIITIISIRELSPLFIRDTIAIILIRELLLIYFGKTTPIIQDIISIYI